MLVVGLHQAIIIAEPSLFRWRIHVIADFDRLQNSLQTRVGASACKASISSSAQQRCALVVNVI